MTKFLFKVLILFTVTIPSLFASQEATNSIAKISSSYLYNIDKAALTIAMDSYIQTNPNLIGLKIKENLSGETYYQMRIENGTIVHTTNPSDFTGEFDWYTAKVKYDEEEVGEIFAYFEKDYLAPTKKQLSFTLQENKWISEHPTIRLAIMRYWASDDTNNNMHTELIRLMGEHSGLNFTPVPFDEWKDGYTEAIKGEYIVGIMNLSYSKVREDNEFNYSKPYSYKPYNLFVKKANNTITSLSDLNNETVYVKKDSITKEILEESSPLINIVEIGNNNDVFEAFIKSDAAATLVYSENDQYLHHGELKIAKRIYGKYAASYIGTSKEQAILSSIVDKILDVIPEEDLTRIQNTNYKKSENKSIIPLNLTADEKAWITTNPVIEVGSEADWSPFLFANNNGEFQGLIVDYLAEIAQLTNLAFEFKTDSSMNELIDSFKNSDIEIIPGIAKSEERMAYVNYTNKPILELPEYIFTNKNASKVSDVKSLYGKKIALIKGYDITNWIRKNHPKITVIEKDTILDCLHSVKSGESFAYIGYSPSTSYNLIKGFVTGIVINNILSERESRKIYFGISKGNETLVSIIDKAIRSISLSKKNHIMERWMNEIDKIEVNEITTTPTSIIALVSYEKLIFSLIFILITCYAFYKLFSKNRLLDTRFTTFNIMIIVFELSVISFLVYEIIIFDRTENALAKTQSDKYEMSQVVNLLKQSDNNLTNFARSYVTTGNIKYKEQYNTVLKIRNGELQRPERYGHIYWDLNEDTRQLTHPLQTAKSLDSFIDALPFTALETEQLKAAEDSSNQLVLIETQAFKAVEKGNKELAIALMYSAEYYQSKHFIMKPIDDLYRNVDKRMASQSTILKEKVSLQFAYLLVVAILFIVANILIYVLLVKKVNRPISYLNETIQKIKNNQPITDKKTFYNDEIGYAIEQFFTMHDAINEQQLNLNKLNVNLESMVEQKMADITELDRVQRQLEEINNHTHSSIEYASLIQHALIPEDDLFANYFNDHLTLWQPKDIVGGDIYLFEELRHEGECIIYVIDCTGHGVPGAFVTMLVKAIERQITSNIINSNEVVNPAKILQIFNQSMKHLLKQNDNHSISNAGFDGGILYYNKQQNIIKYAGSNVSLFCLKGVDKTQEIKGDRHSIGYKKSDSNYEFTEHILEVTAEMQLYITTDGYLDQTGGKKGFSLGKRKFKAILEENRTQTMLQQKQVLLTKLIDYQGDEDRNDDITIIGLNISVN